jgi:hypothetical protein
MNNSKSIVLTLCICVSIFNAFSQVPSYVPTNGLVGWWPFNGNANDESGNGNNGTVNGPTLTADRNGNADKAYNFDGVDDYISNPTNGLPYGNSNRTISCWIRKENNGSQWSHTAVAYGSSSQANAVMLAVGNANTLTVQGWIDDFPANFTNISYEWHMMTFSLNQGIGKIYYDGVQIATQNISQWNTIQSGFYFGTRIDLLNSYFFGQIDDIGIWNRALSDLEITQLYYGCENEISSQPSNANSVIGTTAQFNVGASSGSTYLWQSNPLNLGWQTLNNNSDYSGATSNTLTVSNISVSNHNQPFRAIVNSGGCIDTSDVATILIADTCITNVTVYDTLLTTVTDTLIINTTLSLPAPNNENTILIYPNPASDHITIDNGNFLAMAGYSIKIENNAGQQVFQSAINQQQFYVDLSTWTGDGLYFVHLIDSQNNTVTVRKIVLQ